MKTDLRPAPPPARKHVLLLQSWWQDRLLAGVAQFAAKHNWILDCEMRWSHRVPRPAEWRGDGIIAYVGVTKPLRPLIRFIRAQAAPVVLTQAGGDALRYPRVVIPHAEIGRVAAEHLLRLNFKHFAFIEFADNVMERERGQGFAQAVHQAGYTAHIVPVRDLRRRLRALPTPMGLFAMNDPNALAVMRICLDAGYPIPEKFAVVGADDTEILCNFAPVSLSSVQCNFEAQGFQAAEVLQHLMEGGKPPLEPRLIVPSGVTARRSTDTIAIADPAAARALRHLRDHFLEPIRMPRVAAAAGASLRHIQVRFKRDTGRTLLQELTRLRIEHARWLLRHERCKMEEVARRSGFASRFHFNRTFRRHLGLTPKDYRAQNKPAPPAGRI